jgi:hypothetical protein
VKNSHIINANKVVITVEEADMNTKIDAISAKNEFPDASADATATNLAANSTNVMQGQAGMPVIDTDSDGDLTDETDFILCPNNNTVTYARASRALSCSGTALGTVFQAVSVANGASATTTAKPMITTIVTTADADNDNDTDDAFVAYQSSAVNTFTVNAWSTVQLEANASVISVIETGRNTGIFEAEFIVADTEGVNDNVNVNELLYDPATANATADGGMCGSNGVTAAASASTPADGRFDRSGGVDADCEILTIALNDSAATAKDASIVLTTGADLPAGQKNMGQRW